MLALGVGLAGLGAVPAYAVESSVEIRNLTLVDTSASPVAEALHLDLSTGRDALINAVTTDGVDLGLLLEVAVDAEVLVADSTFHNGVDGVRTPLGGVDGTVMRGGANGMLMCYGSANFATIQNVTMSGFSGFGMEISNVGATVNVFRSELFDNGSVGLRAHSGGAGSVRESTIRDNGGVGGIAGVDFTVVDQAHGLIQRSTVSYTVSAANNATSGDLVVLDGPDDFGVVTTEWSVFGPAVAEPGAPAIVQGTGVVTGVLDQRRLPRVSGDAVDIGSVEVQAALAATGANPAVAVLGGLMLLVLGGVLLLACFRGASTSARSE